MSRAAAAPTVGVAGLVQSGGFGSFSKGYGTAAARLLEAEIVTADGEVRIVNACNDPICSGRSRAAAAAASAWSPGSPCAPTSCRRSSARSAATIKAASDDAFRRLIAPLRRLLRREPAQSALGRAGHLRAGQHARDSMVLPGPDRTQAEAIWQPFFDWVARVAGGFHVMTTARSDRRAGAALVGRRVRQGNPADDHATTAPGARRRRLVGGRPGPGRACSCTATNRCGCPRRCCGRPSARPGRRAVRREPAPGRCELHFNKGLAGAPAEAIAAARDTATNPAVADAFALAIIADGEPPAYPGLPGHEPDLGAARSATRATSPRRWRNCASSPRARAPMSPRADYFKRDWQRRVLGRELSAAARRSSDVRSGRPLLRAPRRRQRGLERGRLHPTLIIALASGERIKIVADENASRT